MSLPNRNRLEFPVVIRKGGEKIIPAFPVELKEGDQLIMVQETCGWQCPPEGAVITGIGHNGPIVKE
jgi:hypothetical protein